MTQFYTLVESLIFYFFLVLSHFSNEMNFLWVEIIIPPPLVLYITRVQEIFLIDLGKEVTK